MREILDIMPVSRREMLGTLLASEKVDELRFRLGKNIRFVSSQVEYGTNSPRITLEELQEMLARACDYSVHTVQTHIAQGFLTLASGHRLGLCGEAVMNQGKIDRLREIYSISLRIAKEFPGVSAPILPGLWKNGVWENTLLLSPPGNGKTSLLRDMIRGISQGEGGPAQRISVVDERGEIAGIQQGVPRFDLGQSTDIVSSCPKSEGMLFLLRSMNPQIIAVDEITAEKDVESLVQVAGCGVKLLATAHGASKEDLKRRPCYRQILACGIFQKLVGIIVKDGNRIYDVEEL